MDVSNVKTKQIISGRRPRNSDLVSNAEAARSLSDESRAGTLALVTPALNFGKVKDGEVFSYMLQIKNSGLDPKKFRIRLPPPKTGLRVLYQAVPVGDRSFTMFVELQDSEYYAWQIRLSIDTRIRFKLFHKFWPVTQCIIFKRLKIGFTLQWPDPGRFTMQHWDTAICLYDVIIIIIIIAVIGEILQWHCQRRSQTSTRPGNSHRRRETEVPHNCTYPLN